jgi:hypothetical protein
MSRKDRKDRAGLRPTTLDLTASEVRDEPAQPSPTGEPAGESVEAASVGEARPPEPADTEPTIQPSEPDRATEGDDRESLRGSETLAAETVNAQAADSERDPPPLDPPATASTAMPPSKQRSGSSWRAWTLGLLASAAIGAGGIWWLTGQATGPAEVAALKSRLAAAETRVETVSRELGEARTALSQVSASLAEVTGRQEQTVAAIDQKFAALPAGGASEEIEAEVDRQRDAIARLDAAVADLKAAIAAASKGGDAGAVVAEAQMKLSAFGARLDELAAKMASLPQGSASADAALGELTSRLDGLEQRLSTGLAEAGTAAAAPKALTAALTGLETKLAQGAPFTAELAAARQAAPQLAALAALDSFAAAGAPTLDQLTASFAGVVAAVNAAAETPDAAPPQTMWDSLVAKLSGVVKVRHRSAVEWPDAVAAASKQLADKDLAAAIATISRPTDPPEAVTDWLAGAQARIIADRAMQDAMHDAVRLMSGTANGG